MKKENDMRNISSSDRSRSIQPAELPEAADGQTMRADGYDEEAIRRRAYERYLERKGADGDADADWFAAEQEIRGQSASAD
jgi:hypothetical protein